MSREEGRSQGRPPAAEAPAVLSEPMFESVTLLGVGLIGSSLARVMRRNGMARRIVGYSRTADTRRRAAALGICDRMFDTAAAAAEAADLIVLCTPVSAFGGLMAAVRSRLKPGAIVTDVGGVKASVVKDVAPQVPPDVHFIPGHPIAGTENSGPESGFVSLFERRWCILTPLPETDPRALARLRAFWEAAGSRVTEMSPERHDQALSVISHLPHALACIMVGVAGDIETVEERELIRYSASGFRDFTRIAASEPEMWRDIFLANRDALLEGMSRFAEELFAVQRAIRWGDGERLVEAFRRGHRIRRRIVEAGQDAEGSALFMSRRGLARNDDDDPAG